MSQRETDQDLVPEPQDEVEERFQNEKQRGSLEAAGRPADSAPSPLGSPRLSFSVFLSLYFGARAGAAAPAAGPHRQKRFPLAFRIPTDPRFPRGCPRCPDSPQFCSAPGGQGELRGAPQRAAGDGLALNDPGPGPPLRLPAPARPAGIKVGPAGAPGPAPRPSGLPRPLFPA